MQNCYAKYVMADSKQMSVYIDKTPPVIELVNGSDKQEFSRTDTNIEKRTEGTIINTSDNIEIERNEIYYNPTENNFDGKTPTNFDNGKEIKDEGYYKIVAVDTSGNKTEIVILIDKSAPEITVKYYKKGEISLIKNMENGGMYVWKIKR